MSEHVTGKGRMESGDVSAHVFGNVSGDMSRDVSAHVNGKGRMED